MPKRPHAAYAEQLYDYAAGRLDAHSLRCWIIGRLMLDEGLDHTDAEAAFEQARFSALARSAATRTGGAPGPRFRHRPVRPAPPAGAAAGPTHEGAPR
jgi:hypothetical protein